jgi:hypothetical protein
VRRKRQFREAPSLEKHIEHLVFHYSKTVICSGAREVSVALLAQDDLAAVLPAVGMGKANTGVSVDVAAVSDKEVQCLWKAVALKMCSEARNIRSSCKFLLELHYFISLIFYVLFIALQSTDYLFGSAASFLLKLFVEAFASLPLRLFVLLAENTTEDSYVLLFFESS